MSPRRRRPPAPRGPWSCEGGPSSPAWSIRLGPPAAPFQTPQARTAALASCARPSTPRSRSRAALALLYCPLCPPRPLSLLASPRPAPALPPPPRRAHLLVQAPSLSPSLPLLGPGSCLCCSSSPGLLFAISSIFCVSAVPLSLTPSCTSVLLHPSLFLCLCYFSPVCLAFLSVSLPSPASPLISLPLPLSLSLSHFLSPSFLPCISSLFRPLSPRYLHLPALPASVSPSVSPLCPLSVFPLPPLFLSLSRLPVSFL